MAPRRLSTSSSHCSRRTSTPSDLARRPPGYALAAFVVRGWFRRWQFRRVLGDGCRNFCHLRGEEAVTVRTRGAVARGRRRRKTELLPLARRGPAERAFGAGTGRPGGSCAGSPASEDGTSATCTPWARAARGRRRHWASGVAVAPGHRTSDAGASATCAEMDL